jgi:FKBP-type peptidyl-prolyl cis-trans isomerase
MVIQEPQESRWSRHVVSDFKCYPEVVRGRGGITFEDIVIGGGSLVERGLTVTIRYSGYLNRGKSFQRNELAVFRVGARRVIAGLEYGVEGMRAGGLRRIHVPPHLGYRERGVPGIPPNAKLTFEIEMISVERDGAA